MQRFYFSISIIIILVGSSIRILAAKHEYIQQWDEAYHALVADNMTINPIEPILLRDLPYSYDSGEWTRARIWLHKPPMAMWLMALSLKMFGRHELFLRLPSILFDILFLSLVLGFGRHVFRPLSVILFSAVWAICCPMISVVAGLCPTDHPDALLTSFLNLCAVGFLWMLAKGPSVRISFLVGVAWAAAYLTKGISAATLPLAVLLCAGISLQGRMKAWRIPTRHWHCILAAIAGMSFALPWPIYSSLRWPAEASSASRYSFLHLSQALEGHRHPLLFHFVQIPKSIWNLDIPWLACGIGLGLVSLAIIHAFRTRSMPHRFLAIWIIITFSLYTFAATKMIRYCLPAYPALLFLLIDGFLSLLIHPRKADSLLIASKRSIFPVYLYRTIFIFLFMAAFTIAARTSITALKTALRPEEALQFSQIYDYSDLRLKMRKERTKTRAIIWNTEKCSAIQASYYSRQTALDLIPSLAELRETQKKGIRNVFLVTSGSKQETLISKALIGTDITLEFISILPKKP